MITSVVHVACRQYVEIYSEQTAHSYGANAYTLRVSLVLPTIALPHSHRARGKRDTSTVMAAYNEAAMR